MSVSRVCLATALRAFNRSGRLLHGLGRESPGLDPHGMVRSARRRTGLEDFGSVAFHGPLRRLVDALEREANLTILGRFLARRHLVSLLKTALWLQMDRAASPAISEQSIKAPVFIVGLPRSGTTLLHNLLVQDNETRGPLTWEAMFPAGFSETPFAQRRARKKSASRLGWLNRLAPDFARIHPIGINRPEECVALMAPGFTSALFHTLYRVPSYQDWFENDPQTSGFEVHHRILQHLQSRRRARRWVLKAPAHLFSLEPLLCRYPDARVVQTHRDPLRAIPSIASLNTVIRALFSDHVDAREVGPDSARRWARAMQTFLRTRDTLPPDRIVDVPYSELVRSPLSEVKRIYRQFGWSISPQAQAAMARYLTDNLGAPCAHRYSLQQFGLDAERVEQRFAHYRERFGIARETDANPAQTRTNQANG